MINTIARYELINLYREKLISVLLAITCLLTSLGLINGQRALNEHLRTEASIVREQATAVENAKKQLQQRTINTAPINWWDDIADARGYAFYLMVDYAVKPPSALAAIAIGQSDIYPNFFKMQVDSKQAVFQSKDATHPLTRYLGKFDLAFFLVFILPLLLIAANFSAMAAERERQQLKTMAVQGLAPAKLLMIQLAVRSSVILLPIFAILSGWLGYTCLAIFNQTFVEAIVNISSVLLLITIYSLFWIGLSGWIISFHKPSAHNATVLIAIWLILVIAIPMTSNTLIKIFAPSASRIIYIDALRKATDAVEKNTEQTLANFLQDHPELTKVTSADGPDYGVVKIAKISAIEKSMQNIESDFSKQLHDQQKFSARLQWLSPASIFYKKWVDLSGNGIAQHHNFVNQAEAHHSALRDYFQHIIIKADERGDFRICDSCLPRPTYTDYDGLPRFAYTPINNYTSIKSYLLILLLIIGIAIGVLARACKNANYLFAERI